jgi:WD40 repeat protein
MADTHPVQHPVIVERAAAPLTIVLALAGAVAASAGPIKPIPEQAIPARADDDPLPEGARARFGSGRWQHGGHVWNLAFAPDGKTVVSGGDDAAVRIWDAGTGRQVRVFTGFSCGVPSVGPSPDGRSLAMMDSDTNGAVILRIRDLVTGAERRFTVRTGVLFSAGGRSAIFAPDGRSVAVADGSGAVILVDAATGQQRPLGRHDHDNIRGLAFAPDGKVLASCGQDGTVRIWDVAGGKELHVLRSEDTHLCSVVFTADGKRLISGGLVQPADLSVGESKASVRMWHVAGGKLLKTLEIPDLRHCACSLALAPDTRILAVGGTGRLILWDLEAGQALRSIPVGSAPYDAPLSLCFSPDGKQLAGGVSHSVCLWEVASGRQLAPDPKIAATSARKLALSDDGRLLAVGGRYMADSGARAVQVWDFRSGRLLRRLGTQELSIQQLAFVPGGRLLAALDNDGTVGLWDADSGQERRRLTAANEKDARSSCLAVSPDGRLLAVGYFAGFQEPGPRFIHIWDLADACEPQRLEVEKAQHNSFVAMGFSADGRTLTATTTNGQTHRWWAQEGRFTGGEVVSTAGFGSMAVGPDGIVATTEAVRNGVIVLDTKTKRSRQLAGPPGFGRVLAFSLDGRYLASAGGQVMGGDLKGRDYSIRIYELASGEEVLQRQPPEGSAVCSAAFAPDGRALVTGMTDSTVLVWDLFPPAAQLGPDALWDDLAHPDPKRAHHALGGLIASGDDSVTFLAKRLEPARSPQPERVTRLVGDLDSNTFGVREKAVRELKAMGELARPALERALEFAPSAEVRSRLEGLLKKPGEGEPPPVETLRLMRAVAALERIGSSKAKELLRSLAAGESAATLTREAQAALRRWH